MRFRHQSAVFKHDREVVTGEAVPSGGIGLRDSLRGGEGSILFPRLRVRAQCPIGWVCGSASPIAVAAAEHSGWPNPLALTPFVKS